MCRTRNKLKTRFSHKSKRSLCTDNRLGKVKDFSFTVPDIPKVVASRVFTYVRLCSLNLVVVCFKKLVKFFIDTSFKVTLAHLCSKLRFCKRLNDAFNAVRDRWDPARRYKSALSVRLLGDDR